MIYPSVVHPHYYKLNGIEQERLDREFNNELEDLRRREQRKKEEDKRMREEHEKAMKRISDAYRTVPQTDDLIQTTSTLDNNFEPVEFPKEIKFSVPKVYNFKFLNQRPENNLDKVKRIIGKLTCDQCLIL